MFSETHWAALLSFGLTSMLILLLIPLARRVGLIDKPDERKRHTAPTPLVGGIAMFLGTAASLWFVAPQPDTFAPFLAGSALLVAFGLIDDARNLDYRIRFAVQACAAAILVFWGDLTIDTLGNLVGLGPVDLGPFSIPFTIFAVVGMINAINMLDGLDGLAGSVTLAILLPVLAFGRSEGVHEIVVPCLLLASSVFAFLLFNYRFRGREKAPVFMGDAGSNFLGFALAWIVVSLEGDGGSGLSPIAILWIVGFPVADTLTTMWRRRRKGLSAFTPDHDHVHYVLRRAKFSVNTTVLIVSGLTALCAIVGILASLDGFPEPMLTLGLLALFAVHNLTLTRAWRFTKRFRRLLATAYSSGK